MEVPLVYKNKKVCMESFEEVYQKYLKEVYCFLLRLSGDREIAEELTPADICHCI